MLTFLDACADDSVDFDETPSCEICEGYTVTDEESAESESSIDLVEEYC